MNTVAILLSGFVLSFVALLAFIWSQRRGLLDRGSMGAEVIFAPGEIGRIEEPAASAPAQGRPQGAIDAASDGHATRADLDELADRVRADVSTAPLVFYFFAIAWLLVASAAGLTASIKLHEPDWLVRQVWLSFGRIRTIHLYTVAGARPQARS